jgi:allantoate deiminase
VIERCRELARITDVADETTRIFLSPAALRCMETVRSWMNAAGLKVRVDAVGNLRGVYTGELRGAARLVIGSHLDTVPNAGAFDGVLGVMLGLELVEMLRGKKLSYAIELVGFSEEEGVRFGTPFIGSRALVGRVDDQLLSKTDKEGLTIRQAITSFGLDAEISSAVLDENAKAYLEFHIEQGPVLDSEGLSLGVVEAIAGQTRGEMRFTGSANHAGTTPMHLRRDAMAAAAQWIGEVESCALVTKGLAATVGRITAAPGTGNVIAGEVTASLDVRHADDAVRTAAVDDLIAAAHAIANERGLSAEWKAQMEQRAVAMDMHLTKMVEDAVVDAGQIPYRMTSGAGHDAMVIAERLPSAMIFLRSPGGLSHHPDEAMRQEDVAYALAAGLGFLQKFDEMVTKTHA